MNRIAVFIFAFLTFVFAGLFAWSFLSSSDLKSKISNYQATLNKIQESLDSAKKEKEQLLSEQEKLQADAVAYIGNTASLEDEKERLKTRVQEVQKQVDSKEAQLQQMKQRIEKAEKAIKEQRDNFSKNSSGKTVELETKVKELEAALLEGKGTYHYNLAVAYTKAGMVEEAIDEYNKSLKVDPKNADAWFNLGVLYEGNRNDIQKAISCYEKYLEYKPDAEDKQEIRELISKLQSR